MNPQPQDLATMGQFLRAMPQKYVLNFNSFIHGFYSPRYVFAPTAAIVQQKKYPDVSFYQGVIQWDLMRGMTDAVIIRAGQNNWVDTQFVRNWAEARARGTLRGVYWFYDGRRSPTDQADLLVSLIKNDPPEMDIIFDWETNYGGAYEGIKNVVAMMKRVEALMAGKYVAMYTGYYWFIQNSNPLTHAAEYAYLKTKGLHLAWYTNDASLVKVPPPWNSLFLWQFGTPAEGAAYGCAIPNIDMNYFNGTLSEFTARYGVSTTPPPPGATMNGTAKENGGRIGNIRTTPSRYGNTVATSPAGVTIQFVKIVNSIDVGAYAADEWFELPDGRFLNYIISGQKYFTILSMPTETPPPPPPTPATPSIYISHTFTDALSVTQPDGTVKSYNASFTVPNVEYKPNP